LKILVPVIDREGLASRISGHFGKAPYYAVIELDEEYNVRNICFIENPRAMGYRPGEYFAQQGIDYVVIGEGGIGVRALENLRRYGVEVLVTNGETLKEIIESIKEQGLKPYTGRGCPGKHGLMR